MKSLKKKILWILLISLSVLQFSLATMMDHDGHETFCAFEEHCILQSVADTTEAIPPLLTIILPVLFVFTLLTRFEQKEIRLASSPPNFKFLQTLEGIVQRE